MSPPCVRTALISAFGCIALSGCASYYDPYNGYGYGPQYGVSVGYGSGYDPYGSYGYGHGGYPYGSYYPGYGSYGYQGSPYGGRMAVDEYIELGYVPVEAGGPRGRCRGGAGP